MSWCQICEDFGGQPCSRQSSAGASLSATPLPCKNANTRSSRSEALQSQGVTSHDVNTTPRRATLCACPRPSDHSELTTALPHTRRRVRRLRAFRAHVSCGAAVRGMPVDQAGRAITAVHAMHGRHALVLKAALDDVFALVLKAIYVNKSKNIIAIYVNKIIAIYVNKSKNIIKESKWLSVLDLDAKSISIEITSNI